ncbi:MAG: PD40 domain-containing protein [Anaerolineales bacterium]|nr:PD40 domain-containing protein [Chloroflexota bacterium]MBL6981461.1 PD40 domain-containing protein [Anaerolineales bacterium]
MKKFYSAILLGLLIFTITSCSPAIPDPTNTPTIELTIPRQENWGIYSLDLSTEKIKLIYSTPWRISGLRLDPSGDRFAFSLMIDGDGHDFEEICTVNLDGSGFQRLTENDTLDTYPAWSPGGTRMAFLAWRNDSMDIFMMNADGSDQRLLYDSGSHDGDVHWVGDQLVYTQNSQIWMINSDGSDAHQISDPPRAGEWGQAVLPFGDYDPNFNPDGSKIAFERMVAEDTQHGNYDIFLINRDGTGETPLTTNSNTQGLPQWSHAGDRIVLFSLPLKTRVYTRFI